MKNKRNTIVDDETKEGQDYLIQPRHINTKKNSDNAFGNDSDAAAAARCIVVRSQERGGWIPLRKDEISEGNFRFGSLVSDCHDPGNPSNFVILGKDNRYRVTHEFIATYYAASPAF